MKQFEGLSAYLKPDDKRLMSPCIEQEEVKGRWEGVGKGGQERMRESLMLCSSGDFSTDRAYRKSNTRGTPAVP